MQEKTILNFVGGNSSEEELLNNFSQELFHRDGIPTRLNFYLNSSQLRHLYDKLDAIYKTRVKKADIQDLMEKYPDLKLLLFPMGSENIEDIVFACITYDVDKLFPRINFYIERGGSGLVVDFLKKEKLEFDGDNLVEASLFDLRRQGIIFGDKLIYYHPFLRRFFQGKFTDTTSLLMKAHDDNDIELKLAVDPSRMTDSKNYLEYVEADYWHGPYFSIENLNDQNYVGTTLHKRMENSQKKILDDTYPINATVFDIKNQSTGPKKSISVEEILPINGSAGITDKVVLHRFAHLEWDRSQQKFTHFDGSVFAYSRAVHNERFRDEWNPLLSRSRGKPTKIKLFRLDGIIQPDYAFQLLGAFFRYNEMISEFFGEKSSNDVLV